MYNQLTSEQRYAIYLGIKRKIPKRKIARAIEVHPSTVFRPLVFTICNVDISCCKIKEVAIELQPLGFVAGARLELTTFGL